jgi:hypothetical protein
VVVLGIIVVLSLILRYENTQIHTMYTQIHLETVTPPMLRRYWGAKLMVEIPLYGAIGCTTDACQGIGQQSVHTF